MKQSFLLVFVSFLLATAAINSLAHEKETLLVVNSNWSPYKDQALPNGGIVTHLTLEALTRAGFKTELVNAPWKRALGGAFEGHYDIVPAIWHTAERANKLIYGPGLLSTKLVIVSRKSDEVIYKSLDDLKDKRVGLGSGWAYPDEISQSTDFIKEEAKDLEANLKKLLLGRLDCIVAEEVATRHTAQKLFGEQADDLVYSEFNLQNKRLHVAISKKTPHANVIKKRFSYAIETMKRDGTFLEILKFHGLGRIDTVRIQ